MPCLQPKQRFPLPSLFPAPPYPNPCFCFHHPSDSLLLAPHTNPFSSAPPPPASRRNWPMSFSRRWRSKSRSAVCCPSMLENRDIESGRDPGACRRFAAGPAKGGPQVRSTREIPVLFEFAWLLRGMAQSPLLIWWCLVGGQGGNRWVQVES